MHHLQREPEKCHSVRLRPCLLHGLYPAVVQGGKLVPVVQSTVQRDSMHHYQTSTVGSSPQPREENHRAIGHYVHTVLLTPAGQLLPCAAQRVGTDRTSVEHFATFHSFPPYETHFADHVQVGAAEQRLGPSCV